MLKDTIENLKVNIYSPERTLLEETAISVGLPGRKGAFTVLTGHVSLVAELEAGLVSVQTAKGKEIYVVDSGFAEVLNNEVTVLVEGAKNPNEINEKEEMAALEEALHRVTTNHIQNEKKQQDVNLRKGRLRVIEQLSRQQVLTTH